MLRQRPRIPKASKPRPISANPPGSGACWGSSPGATGKPSGGNRSEGGAPGSGMITPGTGSCWKNQKGGGGSGSGSGGRRNHGGGGAGSGGQGGRYHHGGWGSHESSSHKPGTTLPSGKGSGMQLTGPALNGSARTSDRVARMTEATRCLVIRTAFIVSESVKKVNPRGQAEFT